MVSLNKKNGSHHEAHIISASRVSASANGPSMVRRCRLIFFHVKYVIKPITFGRRRLPGSAAVYHLPRGILSWCITDLLTLGKYSCASTTKFFVMIIKGSLKTLVCPATELSAIFRKIRPFSGSLSRFLRGGTI